MPGGRGPVVLTAAARVLSRAAAIVAEDAAATAGPVAVELSKERGRSRARAAAAAQAQAQAAAPTFRPPPKSSVSGFAAYSAAAGSSATAGPSSAGQATATAPDVRARSPPRWSDLRKAAAEEDEECPQDMTAYTRYSLSDPLDYAKPPKPSVEVPRPKRPDPVHVGADEGPSGLGAYTPYSLGDPLDYDMKQVREVSPRRSPRWSDLRKAAAEEAEEDCPSDMTAQTAFSLSDPLDYGKPRPTSPKSHPERAPPVFVGKEDARGPTDMTASTMYSMSDPLDYDMKNVREVRQRRAPRWSDLRKAAAEEDEESPHDMTAATRYSLSDPLDYNSPARPSVEVQRPKRPDFKPVFVGREKDEGCPEDMSAMTRYSMSDPTDIEEDVRRGKVGEVKRPARPIGQVGNAMSDPLNAEFSRRERKQDAVKAEEVKEEKIENARDTVEALASEALAKPAPELPPLNVEEDDEPIALRASTVPTSRLGRLFHYGSLGASLAFGAATESIRRTTGGGGSGSVMMNEANVRRLVATLGRMRGAALKLGQFMSIQDNNMLPPEIERVLHQVQQHANYMPEWQMEKAMKSELGPDWESHFAAFDRTPVAAASIGQVHRATMLDGTPAAVKLQFPGVEGSINSDLANISLLLRGSAVLPRGLYLQNTIAVMRRELEDECDYIREGAAGKRFRELLKDDPVFQVPRVIDEATTGKVLTTEWMSGRPLSKMKHMTQEQRDLIGESVLRLCLRELFEFRFMQTDPNWGNFLFDSSTGKIQLIDFGASREYTKEFMDGWYRLLQAALDGDKAAMKTESESLGYLTGEEEEVMVNAHLASMTALASPFQHEGKYAFADQKITEEVRALIPVMLQHRLTPPPAPTYSLNRKLSGAFLMCSKLGANIDCKGLWKDVVGGYKQG